MAEHSSEMVIPNESKYFEPVENSLQHVMKNISVLPPEILCRILSYLPQMEVVRTRLVSRHWKDTIDEHSTMKVKFSENDPFVNRKFQLKIRECKIKWLPQDLINIKFAYPQSIRSIKFGISVHVENVRRLLAQTKHYLEVLEIQNCLFQDNILSPPFIFPKLRELRIKKNDRITTTTSQTLYFDILFHHRVPLLEVLHFQFRHSELNIMDETYKGFFNFLAIHQQTIKDLNVKIELKTDFLDDESLCFYPAFEIPNPGKNALYNGTLKLEHFELNYSSRYIPAWSPIIKRQENLITFSNNDVGSMKGVLSNIIFPVIKSNFATLRSLSLWGIDLLDSDGRTYIPFDCSALRDVVNLSDLTLYRSWSSKIPLQMRMNFLK